MPCASKNRVHQCFMLRPSENYGPTTTWLYRNNSMDYTGLSKINPHPSRGIVGFKPKDPMDLKTSDFSGSLGAWATALGVLFTFAFAIAKITAWVFRVNFREDLFRFFDSESGRNAIQQVFLSDEFVDRITERIDSRRRRWGTHPEGRVD